MPNIRRSPSGKMLWEPSHLMEGKTSRPSSPLSWRPKFQFLPLAGGQPQEWSEAERAPSLGASWMLNIGESPSEERESSLSAILEPADSVGQKYYLTPLACEGILRRAQRAGKELPPKLAKALRNQWSLTTREANI